MLKVSRFLLLFFVISPSSWAADSRADSEQRLTALLSRSHSFQASFLQYTLDSSGANIQEIKGKIWLQRPHLFRWHAEPPFEQIIVSDGRLLWFYDPDLEQVIVQKFDARIARTPVVLLSGEVESWKDSFDIYSYTDEIGNHFVLEPLLDESLFEVLTLTFRNGHISQIRMEDSLAQKTSIQFHNGDYNQPIDPQVFKFTVPAGVDVIRDY